MTYKFSDEPLSLLVSARLRLSHEERASIKQAYQTLRAGYQPQQRTSTNGSSIVVEERNYSTGELDTALGMSSIIFADIINSRDTISIPVIMKIQKVLGVEVLTKKRLLDACKSYVDYVFQMED